MDCFASGDRVRCVKEDSFENVIVSPGDVLTVKSCGGSIFTAEVPGFSNGKWYTWCFERVKENCAPTAPATPEIQAVLVNDILEIVREGLQSLAEEGHAYYSLAAFHLANPLLGRLGYGQTLRTDPLVVLSPLPTD